MHLLQCLKRGVFSGAVSGAVFGGFAFLLAEPLMDRAVSLESARQASAGEHPMAIFSRNTQHVGLLVAAILVGLSLGVLFGVAQALLHRDDTRDTWGQALRLGAGGFFALSLVPFMRYPSNPPGVGDSATIGTRSHLYLVVLVIGLVGVTFAGLIARGLRERGVRASLRQLAVTGVCFATIALTFVLPDNTDEVIAPVSLVWEFRLLSIAGLALLWGGLAATYGLLSERAVATAAAPTPSLT